MMRPRIFLADDHSLLLEAFSKLLESKYDIVGTATDGRKMLALVSKLKPDVVLMDIAMPNLNGFDAGEKLKKLRPEIKLIFLTVNEDPEIVTEAFRIGANSDRTLWLTLVRRKPPPLLASLRPAQQVTDIRSGAAIP